MPRPRFQADPPQQAVLDALRRLTEQRAAIDDKADELIARAKKMDVPIDAIARAAGRTRKTVYRHLGRPMK